MLAFDRVRKHVKANKDASLSAFTTEACTLSVVACKIGNLYEVADSCITKCQLFRELQSS